jgi:hypothetical protein
MRVVVNYGLRVLIIFKSVKEKFRIFYLDGKGGSSFAIFGLCVG